MKTERMNIFGDDLDESKFNNTEEDEPVFYSDVVTSDNSSLGNRQYGYIGRGSRRYSDVSDDYEYEDTPTHKIKRDRVDTNHIKPEKVIDKYNRHKRELTRDERKPHYNYRSSNYSNYSSTPQFSKEQNGKFASQLIAAILIVLAIIFVIKGDSAYTGVVLLVLIMYVMGVLNSNKKGNNRK